jgi:hypothetical protein
MKCDNCGVEVEEKHQYCPLCLEPLYAEHHPDSGSEDRGAIPGEPGQPAQSVQHGRPPLQTRFRAGLWLIEAFSMVAGVAALVIFAADFAFSSEVGWSRYPLVSIALLWAVGVTAVLFRAGPILFSVALFVLAAAYCYLVDRFLGAPFWFVPIALPNMAVLLLLVTGSLAVIRRKQLRLLQILSLVSLSTGIMLIVIEGSLRHYLEDEIDISWSLLGFACFTAVAVVVFYLHRSLRKRHRDIRRYLHL